jgi:predicted PurR-regulated permease PerM
MHRAPKFQTLLVTLVLLALVLATAELLVPALSVILLTFAGLLFGVFVHGLSEWLANHSSASYRTSYLVVVALLLLVIGVGCFYLGSQVVTRADELWTKLQTTVDSADNPPPANQWLREHLPNVSQLQKQLTDSTSAILPKMFQGLQWLGWTITGALVIFFIGLYAAYEPQLYRAGLVRLVSIDRRPRMNEVLDQLKRSLGRWIVGRFVSMTIVGLLTAIAMWLLGVPLPVSLGVLAALLTFIPNIGPLLAAIPQLLLAADLGTQTVFYVLLFNLILQTVESYMITPVVQRHEVSLPPILTIAAQLLMGVVAGIIGVMMAAPLVVVAMVLVQMLYVHDYLGDSEAGELTAQ